jgi:maleylacetate reductase
MKPATWHYPPLEKVVLGTKAADAVLAEATRLACTRVFVLTSRSVARTEVVASIAEALDERFAGSFAGIPAHAPLESVLEAAAAARATEPDLLVCVGGGSAIDASKLVVLCLRHDITEVVDLKKHRGFGAAAEPGRRPDDEAAWTRMIAVPTTLSAAEFTWWGDSQDTEERVKAPYAHPSALGPAANVIRRACGRCRTTGSARPPGRPRHRSSGRRSPPGAQ